MDCENPLFASARIHLHHIVGTCCTCQSSLVNIIKFYETHCSLRGTKGAIIRWSKMNFFQKNPIKYEEAMRMKESNNYLGSANSLGFLVAYAKRVESWERTEDMGHFPLRYLFREAIDVECGGGIMRKRQWKTGSDGWPSHACTEASNPPTIHHGTRVVTSRVAF